MILVAIAIQTRNLNFKFTLVRALLWVKDEIVGHVEQISGINVVKFGIIVVLEALANEERLILTLSRAFSVSLRNSKRDVETIEIIPVCIVAQLFIARSLFKGYELSVNMDKIGGELVHVVVGVVGSTHNYEEEHPIDDHCFFKFIIILKL